MTRTSPTDPFEDEIRRALAREAAEPAPDRLVSRVAGMRRAVAPEWWLTARLRALFAVRAGGTMRAGLAVIAVAAVAVAAGILVRGAGPSPSVGGPSPVVSPASSVPSAVASPSPAASTAAPTATPPASPAPSAAPSTVPPSPSRAPGAGPVGGPVPAGFEPRSVTFVSASDGWVLGSATCAGQPCAAIVRTTDGGRTWQGIPAPKATINDTPVGPSGGVSDLRFADPLDGWAFGPDLWATHDGGSTWHKLTLPGATANAGVWALETAGGAVHAAFEGAGAIGIATSPAGSDDWTVSRTTVDFGAGPVPTAQLVLHGTSGWLVEVDRTVIGGARLDHGAWTPWQPPCRDANGPAALAAAGASDLVAVCDVGVWSTPTGVHLYTSVDGGTSFREAASKVPVFDIQAVSEPAPSTILVAGSLSGVGSAIVASSDGGRTWAAVEVLEGSGVVLLPGLHDDEPGRGDHRAGQRGGAAPHDP